MSTAMMVDTYDIDFDLLVDEVMDHQVRCGAKADRMCRKTSAATVRAALAGIAAQGLKLTPGPGCVEAVNLVVLARYLFNSRPTPRPEQVAAAFGAARSDAYIVTRALCCQDVTAIPAA